MTTRPSSALTRGGDLVGRPWDSTPGRTALALLPVGVLGFIAVMLAVGTGWAPLRWLDHTAAERFATWSAEIPVLLDVFRVVDVALSPGILRVLAFVIAVLMFRSGLRRTALWLGGTVLVGWGVQWAAKELVARQRPDLVDFGIYHDLYAFPSGHALTSALVAGALLFVGLQRRNGRRYRGLFWTVAVAAVLLVGLDRVGLVVHYVSDVVAGWFLAVALLAISMLVFGVTRPGHLPRSHQTAVTYRRLAVICNPTKIDDDVRFRRRLHDLADEHGWDLSLWLETEVADAGYAMARAALDAEVDLVVVAGGDGTVRAACSQLAGTGVPVGIIPVGTGNLLARNLGLPLDHEDAIAIALAGEDRAMDIVRVEGDGLEPDRFAVMAGLGFDAAVVGEAPDSLKAQVGWPAYVVSIARNLDFPAVRVEVQVDDQAPVRCRAIMVLVGNVGHLHGGLPLLPQAQPDDGMIDVVLIAPRRVSAWPRLLWRVVSRSGRGDDQLIHLRGQRVSIRTAESMPRQLDGDVFPPGHELRAAVEPGSLVVRVPRSRSLARMAFEHKG